MRTARAELSTRDDQGSLTKNILPKPVEAAKIKELQVGYSACPPAQSGDWAASADSIRWRPSLPCLMRLSWRLTISVAGSYGLATVPRRASIALLPLPLGPTVARRSSMGAALHAPLRSILLAGSSDQPQLRVAKLAPTTRVRGRESQSRCS